MNLLDQMVRVDSRESFDTQVFTVPADTSEIRVRIPRGSHWPSTSRVSVEIAMIVDGVEYRAKGSATGGVRINGEGKEIPEYQLIYHPPVVGVKRIGELGAKAECQVRVRSLSGDSDVRVTVDVLSAPVKAIL